DDEEDEAAATASGEARPSAPRPLWPPGRGPAASRNAGPSRPVPPSRAAPATAASSAPRRPLPPSLSRRPAMPAIGPAPPAAGDAVALVTAPLPLDEDLALVVAWCERALAEGWDSGRLGETPPGALPFEHEAAALLSDRRGLAAEKRRAAEEKLARLEAE